MEEVRYDEVRGEAGFGFFLRHGSVLQLQCGMNFSGGAGAGWDTAPPGCPAV